MLLVPPMCHLLGQNPNVYREEESHRACAVRHWGLRQKTVGLMRLITRWRAAGRLPDLKRPRPVRPALLLGSFLTDALGVTQHGETDSPRPAGLPTCPWGHRVSPLVPGSGPHSVSWCFSLHPLGPSRPAPCPVAPPPLLLAPSVQQKNTKALLSQRLLTDIMASVHDYCNSWKQSGNKRQSSKRRSAFNYNQEGKSWRFGHVAPRNWGFPLRHPEGNDGWFKTESICIFLFSIVLYCFLSWRFVALFCLPIMLNTESWRNLSDSTLFSQLWRYREVSQSRTGISWLAC